MANFNFNKIILGGRLTADPELRQTSNGIPVSSFTIAVSRKMRSRDQQQPQGTPAQPTADFFNCIAWRSNAELVTRYFRKGSAICVIGSLQNRSWVDQQNQKRYATDVVVDEINFVDSKGDNPANGEPGQYQAAPPTNQYSASNYAPPSYASDSDEAAKFEDLQNDDDLPF